MAPFIEMLKCLPHTVSFYELYCTLRKRKNNLCNDMIILILCLLSLYPSLPSPPSSSIYNINRKGKQTTKGENIPSFRDA